MALSVDDGIGRVIELGKARIIRPILVAVSAPGTHHGKSYFISKACQSLSAQGYDAWFTTDFDHSDGYVPYLMNDRDYYFLHIGMSGPVSGYVNRRTREYAGRDVDIHVLVYNPQMMTMPLRTDDMDIVVENPGSTRKGKL